MSRAIYQDLKFKPGIARTKAGEPMASLELVTVIVLPTPENPAGNNVNLRASLPPASKWGTA